MKASAATERSQGVVKETAPATKGASKRAGAAKPAPAAEPAKAAPAKAAPAKATAAKPTAKAAPAAAKPTPAKAPAAKPAAPKAQSAKAAPAKAPAAAPAAAKQAPPAPVPAAKPAASKTAAAQPAAVAATSLRSVTPAPAPAPARRPATAPVPAPAPKPVAKPQIETSQIVTASANEAPAATPAPAEAPAARPAQAEAQPQRPVMHGGRPAVSRASNKDESFAEGDYVVYPTHGVGKVEKIAKEEIAGHHLELIHITFEENRMTLRVPVSKARSAGLRKLATRKIFDEALAVLKGRARVKRTMWSRRAQEYEAKINSGDPAAIAEVVRDLHRNAGQPDQSFSERQIYEAAMDRLAAELGALDQTDKMTALIKLGNFLKTL
jgi:CarD family transcriptional regulator